MKKFLIHTMGCKSNQFETAVIKENLEINGYQEVQKVEDADVYILNSCSVTHKSDNEALYLLRNSKHKNPQICNVITGCVAQIEKAKLLEYDFVDMVVGNDEKLKMAEILAGENKLSASDIMLRNEFTYTELSDTSKTRAGLKIQDGCDNRCNYCIIPYARGNSRSAQVEFIINQIKNFEQKGFKEVIFTGIHIGLWGKEFNKTLLDLLKEIEEKTTIERYRLGSLYPNEIDDEMLEFLCKSDKFCPHFHLSLQSACNKTLRSMNRHYTVEDYLLLIDKINSKFESPFIGSDVITGFAGETEEDFEITRSNIEKSGLSQIHTFPYSKRAGTPGALALEQVNDKTKEQRADVIKEISRKKYTDFVNKNIGTIKEVLIEKHADKKSGLLKGVTRNYLTVLINSKDLSLTNTLQNVYLKEVKQGKIYGELITGNQLPIINC